MKFLYAEREGDIVYIYFADVNGKEHKLEAKAFELLNDLGITIN